jgi:2,4-dienoyl-CoA reductase-like NADH-dependent reductase (Old Yellow Enzyme family)
MNGKAPGDFLRIRQCCIEAKSFGTERNMSQITGEASSLPIMICGKIHDRRTAEAALKDADLVLSAKSMLLNPHWIEAMRAGKTLPLRKSEEADVAYTETPLP